MKKIPVGPIFFIVGTSIGAGMLALPMQTAQIGFVPTTLLFLITWMIMLAAAYFLYEVALACPKGANIMTMAEHTLGPTGKTITYTAYIALLYLLNAAYLSGIHDMLASWLALPINSSTTGIMLGLWVIAFACIIYVGYNALNRLNLILVGSLITLFIALMCVLLPHIHPKQLALASPFQSWQALPVIITAFGYQIIIPTLCHLWHEQPASLKKPIFIGSLIPLLFYILWEASVLGILPTHGAHSLLALDQGPHQVSVLLSSLNQKTHWPGTHLMISSFSTLAIITSFVGVSISLFDALLDALPRFKQSNLSFWLLLLTFCPSLLFTFLYPQAFIVTLGYAGIFVAILLAFVPTWMVLSKRKKEPKSLIIGLKNKYIPFVVMTFSIVIIAIECYHPAI
jgi:tyrosine-specific transport protein